MAQSEDLDRLEQPEKSEKALAHAWSYFALHSQQRMTVFNYFIVFAGILCTGLAAAMQGSHRLALIGVSLGLLLVLLSFVFWQLDQRTSFLIKHAENYIKSLEPHGANVVATEESATISKRDASLLHLSYGHSLRIIFLVMALVGLTGGVLSALRAAGAIDMSEVRAELATKPGSAYPPSLETPLALGTPANVRVAEKAARQCGMQNLGIHSDTAARVVLVMRPGNSRQADDCTRRWLRAHARYFDPAVSL